MSESQPKIWLVTHPKDQTVLLATEIKISDKNISWFDGTQTRNMNIAELAKTENGFKFKSSIDPSDESYSFEPLTMQLYNEKVRDVTIAKKNFSNLQELEDDMRISIRSAW